MKHALAAAFVLLLPTLAAAEEPSTRILDQVYARANERLVRGQAAQAAEGFQVVADAVPELPEPNAAAALALTLADWSRRDDAVAYVRRALAVEPANPVAGVIAVIVDPALSVLRDDGALYLTPWGRERLQRASELAVGSFPGLRGQPQALRRLAASGEATHDSYFPSRIPGFRRLMSQPSFAAMFVVDVPSSRLAVYDPRIVTDMRRSVAALATNQRRLEELRARLDDVRSTLVAYEHASRAVRTAATERRIAELETSASEREQRVLMLQLRDGRNDDLVRRERAWIDELNRAAADQRRHLAAIRAGHE